MTPASIDDLARAGDAATIVIGGGIAGAAVIEALVKGGLRDVWLVERGTNHENSTSQSIGMVRVFEDDPVWTALAADSFHDFHSIPASDPAHVTRTGFLYIFRPADAHVIRQRVERHYRTGIPLEYLKQTQAARRFPHIDWTDTGGAVLEPYAGYVDPIALCRRMLAQAADGGARVVHGSVDRIVVHGGRVVGMGIDDREVSTTTVIVAAGASAPALLHPLGYDTGLRTKEIQVGEYEMPDLTAVLPGFRFVDGDLYGRPSSRGRMYVGQPVDIYDHPTDAPRRVDSDLAHQCHVLGIARMALLKDARLVGGRRGYDGYTSDRRPLVGPVEGVAGLYVVAGLSGSGLKAAPALGRKALQWLCSARKPGHAE